MILKPFIKWAGGKTQLLDEIRSRYPFENKNIKKYCEPFLGGGAVLFDILTNYKLDEILINDINLDLTNAYIMIKDNIDNLIEKLKELENKYIPMDNTNRKEFYYSKRKRFNSIIIKSDSDKLEKASLFIFLNRTCFNGLFRVNKKGYFNVPMGSYKNPLICDEDNLKRISRALKNVVITNGSYKECEFFIDKYTFVYFDPPYRPLSKTASFTSYSRNNFNDKDQIDLEKFVSLITDKGAKVLLSNSDPKNSDINDNFFDDLYKNYNIERVNAKRRINSNAKNRGVITELLINNYRR